MSLEVDAGIVASVFANHPLTNAQASHTECIWNAGGNEPRCSVVWIRASLTCRTGHEIEHAFALARAAKSPFD